MIERLLTAFAALMFFISSVARAGQGDALVYSTAHSTGVMSVIRVPAETVSKTLPRGLTLVPRLIQPDGKYPVALFVGTHNDLTSHFAKTQLVVEKTYQEATFTVTVLHTSHEYSYTSRILVNSVPAMLMGWALGYPKVLSKITSTETQFRAEKNGELMTQIQMSAVQTPDWQSFQTNLGFLASEMRPTIGSTPLGFICFDLNWDFTHAKLAPAAVDVELSDLFMGRRLGGHYQSPSLDENKYGSFFVESDWRMDGFRRCD